MGETDGEKAIIPLASAKYSKGLLGSLCLIRLFCSEMTLLLCQTRGGSAVSQLVFGVSNEIRHLVQLLATTRV